MDSKSRLILLLVAGVLVTFAVIALRNRMSAPEEAPVEPTAQVSTRIIVAKRDIPAGTFIQIATDLDWAPAPIEEQPQPMPASESGEVIPGQENIMPAPKADNYLHEGRARLEDFKGAIVRRALRAGEPVTPDLITRSGEGGFMSAVLEPGMRAVSVAVTPTSGNAGFISPGDRVDLIVTHHVKSATSGGDSVLSETFVRNIRVLAIDQILDNPDNKAILVKTITVQVSPRQAEQIAVASEVGKLSMALRSVIGQQPKTANTDSAVSPIVDLYDTAGKPPSEGEISQGIFSSHVRVIRGDTVENIELY